LPKIKYALKEQRFQNTENLQQSVMTALKAIPQQEFQNVSNGGNIVRLIA
jgi:hypothetical protein